MSKFDAKIAAGIKLLDNHVGSSWRDSINLDTLNLGSCSVCVLGQVFGDYQEGLDELDLEEGYDYGFNTMSGDMTELTAAWKVALGKNNVLVEKGDVYKDSYGYAVKILQTHTLTVEGKTVITYLAQSGTVTGGKFKAYGDGSSVTLYNKDVFEPGGGYSIKVKEFQVQAGMFLVNDAGETFYAVSHGSVRPIKDGAYAVWLTSIDQKGLRELTLPNGDLFSSKVVVNK